MAPTQVSAIGMALNGKSASVDIPKPRDGGFLTAGRDNLTAVSATANGNKKHRGMLPTPPNSISPNLPPRRTSRQLQGAGTSPSIPESDDIELQDASAQKQQNSLTEEALDSLGDLDSAGAITPGLLAKHHLPDVLLNHGPLAIRHIMGYLTNSVPGFSRIASAKARRLVVAALEGRGSGQEGGGLHGDVMFEKVGWGRWDACLKGQPPRERPQGSVTPPGSLPNSHSLQIPGQRSYHAASDHYGSSVTNNSGILSNSEMEDEDVDMLEHEADKMSLDGNEDGYVSSEAPPEFDQDLGEGDVTDEEDWQSMGIEALRARSLPKNGRRPSGGGRIYQPISYSMSSRHRSRTPGFASHSVPVPPIPAHHVQRFTLPPGISVGDSQERAAVEALLSLGSM